MEADQWRKKFLVTFQVNEICFCHALAASAEACVEVCIWALPSDRQSWQSSVVLEAVLWMSWE